ncbi:MAG: RNA polymerase sigma factor, partial [Rhabdochlamydiaceae bacterium]
MSRLECWFLASQQRKSFPDDQDNVACVTIPHYCRYVYDDLPLTRNTNPFGNTSETAEEFAIYQQPSESGSTDGYPRELILRVGNVATRNRDENLASESSELSLYISGALEGDEMSLEKLFGGLTSHLEGYFARVVGGAVAEDLTQQTLLAIYEGLDDFDPKLGRGNSVQNFLAWSFTIARHKAGLERRTKNRAEQVNVSLDAQRDSLGRPIEYPDKSEATELTDYEDLHNALLSELGKYFSPYKVDRLRYKLEGKTDEEISVLQDASPMTVNSS